MTTNGDLARAFLARCTDAELQGWLRQVRRLGGVILPNDNGLTVPLHKAWILDECAKRPHWPALRERRAARRAQAEAARHARQRKPPQRRGVRRKG